MRRNVCLQIPDHFALATGNDPGQSRFGSPCSGCLLLSHRQSCLPLSCVHHVVDHQLCYSTGNHACATVCSRFLRYKSRFPSVQHFSGEVLQTHSAYATKFTACIITRLTLYHCPRNGFDLAAHDLRASYPVPAGTKESRLRARNGRPILGIGSICRPML
jgi:hypothetical protein